MTTRVINYGLIIVSLGLAVFWASVIYVCIKFGLFKAIAAAVHKLVMYVS